MNTTKNYQIIRAWTGEDEFDGDVYQLVEWAVCRCVDNGENKMLDMFYLIPARWEGEQRERALIEWVTHAVHGEFWVREVE